MPVQEGTVVVDERGSIEEAQRFGYQEHRFELPEGVSELAVQLRFADAMLFLSLYGPRGYRGTVMKPGARGGVELEARCGARAASPGIIAGTLEAGQWRIVIDHSPGTRNAAYELRAAYSTEGDAEGRLALPDAHQLGQLPGWYRGELHAHSAESDGRKPAAEVAAVAEAAELDCITLTDHFTVSGCYHMRRARLFRGR
jgi:hypothetical protein